MRIAYLECATGISGDMTLAALIDAGADEAVIRRGIESLGLPGVTLHVEVEDRRGLLAEITSLISEAKTNIRQIESRMEEGRGRINLIVDVADVAHLQRIKQVVRKIPGVSRIVRVGTR